MHICIHIIMFMFILSWQDGEELMEEYSTSERLRVHNQNNMRYSSEHSTST